MKQLSSSQWMVEKGAGSKVTEGTSTGSFVPADFFVPADLQSAGI